MRECIVFHFGRYRLSPATRELRRDGDAVAIPARVFDCIVYLIEHRVRAVGRDEIGAAIWGKADVSEALLTKTILRARRLLGDDAGDQGFIRTVPRFGYHWTGAVRVESERLATAESAPMEAQDASSHPRESPDNREGRARPLRFARIAFVLAAVAVGIAVFVVLGSHPPRPAQGTATVAAHGALVLPVDGHDGDDYAWVRLGAIDVIAGRLRAAGLPVPPTETTLALLDAGTGDTRALNRDAGTQWIVSSSARRSARGWRVLLRAADAAGNELTASTEGADLLTVMRNGADLLLTQMGLAPPAPSGRNPAVDEVLQRAQAAMLENDFEAARQVLTSSAAATLEEPELRYQLAVLAFRAGRLDDAEAQLRSLSDDKSDSANPQRLSQIHYALGAIAMMRDRFVEGEREFDQALVSLDRRRDPLDYGKALGGRGGARLSQGRQQDGFDDLGVARSLLEQAGDRLALARMNLTFGIALLRRDQSTEAIQVLTSALAQLEPFGAINERVHAYSALCNAQLERLDYAAASQANEAAWALLARIGDPLNRAETLLDRLSVLLGRGQFEATVPVFVEADALDLAAHAGLDGRRDDLHAQLAWARGDTASALARAEAAIPKLAGEDADAADQMLLLRQRALLALGRREEAATLLREDARGHDHPSVDLRLARAELAAAGGDPVVAGQAFAAALADAESRNRPSAIARVAATMVPYLLAQGQIDAASAIVGRLTPLADQDFDAALSRARVHQAAGRVRAWTDALRDARSVAGERTIPSDLQVAPAPGVR
jgi:DNA-binding winged helix-turn-helix (wHTH) protein/tetratricopeptide (TPR) repeat protein